MPTKSDEFAALRKLVEQSIKSTEEFEESTKKFIKDTEKQIEIFESKWENLVEALVEPSSLQAFKQRNIEIDGSARRVKRKSKKYGATETDVLLSNTDIIILIQVRTTLEVDDVKEHIEKKLKRFKSFFPEYNNEKAYGGVAYINVDAEADKYAIKNGLFVLTLIDENIVKIINDPEFKPINFNKNTNKNKRKK